MANDEDYPDLYFDETDEFFDMELQHVERKNWDDLLSLYEQELEKIGEADQEEANDLRSRIESTRKKVYDDTEEGQY